MIREELYNKTLAILENAYKNKLVDRNNSTCCGVGHLITVGMRYKHIKRNFFGPYTTWEHATKETHHNMTWFNLLRGHNHYGSTIKAEAELRSTGYTNDELTLLEKHSGTLESITKALKFIHGETDTI